MPEYLSPGVYLEEVSFRAKTIEGVSTSTAGFIGPTRFGPFKGEPELLTSFADFERIYGSLDQLAFEDGGEELIQHNFLAHAVRSFFEEGGKRLYVTRTWSPRDDASATDGYASLTIPGPDSPVGEDLRFRARYPGSGGNFQVTFTARVGQNALSGEPLDPAQPDGAVQAVLRGVNSYDLVWIASTQSPPVAPQGSGTVYWTKRYFDSDTNRYTYGFYGEDKALEDDSDEANLPDFVLSSLTPGQFEVRVVTLAVEVAFRGRSPRSAATRVEAWDGVGFHPRHSRSLAKVFAAELRGRLQQLTVPLVFLDDSLNGPQIARTLLGQPRPSDERPRLLRLLELEADDVATDLSILATLGESVLSDADRRYTLALSGGHDGVRPGASDYEGEGDDNPNEQTGLKSFENIADISIVAAPGHSFDDSDDGGYAANTNQIMRHLISHCERMRYRIAVLDAPNGLAISEVRAHRQKVDSKHAAYYYPWIKILDPVTEEEILLPPSGYVAGIYARNDVEQGVHKAPANEVVRSAIGLELMLNKAQQDVLNPEGINCFRYFEGRGYRLWGARTISSDPEWKYVNLRRYFAYLERSVERGTQWIVFENNHEPLWANVRRTVEDFLFNEWKSGHLMGEKPQEAYFVRCDRSTMTQNDIDNGRLICLIGIAPVRPAEFVIFRIGQWTADRRG